jgi:ubiquinone/menaquinone biosynthesis C-methylase UbiE
MPAFPLKGSNIDLSDFHKDATPNIHQQARYDLIQRLLDQIPKGGRGLDYGCGMGDVTHTMSGHFDFIIGVDVTPQRVEWANIHYAPLQFQVCDSRTLAFPDASFDAVISSVVINWADSPVSYLENIHKVLVTGGHLLILVRGTGAIRNALRLLIGKKRLPPVAGFKNIGLEQLSSMMGAKFKIIDTDCLYEEEEAVPLTLPKIIFKIAQLPFKLFKSRAYADYYGVLAQKTSQEPRASV